jgi:hypothetical protein
LSQNFHPVSYRPPQKPENRNKNTVADKREYARTQNGELPNQYLVDSCLEIVNLS